MNREKILPAPGGERPAGGRKDALSQKEAEDFVYQIENILKMVKDVDDDGTEYRYLEVMAEALLFVLHRLKLFRTLFFIVFGCIVGHLIGQIF